MIKKNLHDLEKIHFPLWRKMAFATWSLTGDSSTYARSSVATDKALAYIKKLNEQSPETTVTLTHFTAQALALCLKRYPATNRIIRFGKYFQRKYIDIFFLIASDRQGKDLSGKVLHNVDQKNLNTISKELRKSVKKIRVSKKLPFKILKSIVNLLPMFIAKPLTGLLGFTLYSLNINPTFLKMDRNPFGCAMVTSVSTFGIESAYAPLSPFTRVPLIMSIGCAQTRLRLSKDKEVYEEGFIELGFTVDHRFIDGVHGGQISEVIAECFENPEMIDMSINNQSTEQ